MNPSEAAPQLLLIRHAPTLWNDQGVYQGKTDIPLSPQSLIDLSERKVLEPYRAWKLYSSPLARAQQTAETLFGRKAEVVREAAEIDYGLWEGQSIQETQAALPPAENPFGWRGLDFKAPQGESNRDVQQRASIWLSFFHQQGQNAVLVTHKGFILAILAQAWSWSMDRKRPFRVDYEKGQVLAIEAGGQPKVLQLNVEFYSK